MMTSPGDDMDKVCRQLAKVKKGRIDALRSTAIAIGRLGVERDAGIRALRSACLENGTFEKETPQLIEKTINDGLDEGSQAHSGNGKLNGHAQPRSTLDTKAASSFKLRALQWFWKDRIPLGKLSLLGGLPDKGKGLIGSFLAACATAKLPLPMNEGDAPQGNVIYLSAEDDAEDTIVPRLLAAGANADHVHIVRMMHEGDKQRTFSMLTDLEALRAVIDRIGNVVLIIIDPISAYVGVGKVNNSMASDVRGFLQPFCDLAAEKRLSILGVTHLNKKADVGSAMLRFSDSIAYPALARSVYMAADDPEVEGQRIFARVKGNLGPDKKALTYMVGLRSVGTDEETSQEIFAPYLEWGGKYVEITANEAMQAETGGKRGRTERIEAKEFLLERLADGPVTQEELMAEGEAMDISAATLRRAKKDLKIVSKKGKGIDKAWTWELPQ